MWITQCIHFWLNRSTSRSIAKKITFRLRKGIKFTDGSDLNAEAVAWNYQRAKDTGKLQFRDKLEKIEVVDDLTMVLHVTGYDNQMLSSFGWVPIFSKKAWDEAGATDEERKKWARANVVATGPFILKEYQMDHHMTWVKNPNYWMPGKPYLDGIEIKFIPDPVTASTMMQAGEADMWTSGSNVLNWADLEKKGFLLKSTPTGILITMYFNNVDKASPFMDQRVREAVEYAIDKTSISKALGQGYYTPLTHSAGPNMWGYDPNYKGRPYNPEKARQLLKEAGYPNGLKTKMLVFFTPDWQDRAQAIKQYLDAAGFQIDLDVADPGRFFSMMWGGVGWPDMLLFLQATAPSSLVCLHRTFGPQPMTPMASFVQPKPLIDLFYQARMPEIKEEQIKMAGRLIKWLSDDCLLVPLWQEPQAYLISPKVHTTYYQETVVMRHYQNEWKDK